VEGTTHAATGLLLGVGAGLLTSVPHAHGAAVAGNIGHDLLFGVLTAGFALLPDADHPDATFAHSAGGLSHGASHVIAALFGGHRQGFHSFFGAGVMGLITASCTLWQANRYALGGYALFLAVCVVAGLKATGFMRHRGGGSLDRAVAGCGIAALAVLYARQDLWWLVMLGMGLHVLEDEFTGHGCALLWPLSHRRFGGDGRQPARRRSPGRRPKSEYQRARERAQRRPVAPGPPAGPARPAVKPTCPACWLGNCPECKDRGCSCPERGVHLKRPKRGAAAAVEPVPLPAPEDDIPPF
jgi:membrane-bound metal-dependent hydrolase YbcI (DUF457 family)